MPALVKFAQAGEASVLDLEVYQRCSNTLRRHLETIYSGNLQRRQIDVTPPTLAEIAREIEAEKRESAEGVT